MLISTLFYFAAFVGLASQTSYPALMIFRILQSSRSSAEPSLSILEVARPGTIVVSSN